MTCLASSQTGLSHTLSTSAQYTYLYGLLVLCLLHVCMCVVVSVCLAVCLAVVVLRENLLGYVLSELTTRTEERNTGR